VAPAAFADRTEAPPWRPRLSLGVEQGACRVRQPGHSLLARPLLAVRFVCAIRR